MTNPELIVELLLDTIEERATGIFRKVLDSGREVYTCKCPVCGTLHGGYKTFAEASANRKCKMHFRNEIEKTKKDIQKVDEPEKPRNIFQKSMRQPAVLGEAEVYKNAVDEAEDDLKSLIGPDMGFPPTGDVTKLTCLNLHYGQNLYHRTKKMSDGAPLRVRVSGRCKTWSTRPDEFRLPVKFGLYQSFYITHHNAGEWTTVEPQSRGKRALPPDDSGGGGVVEGRADQQSDADADLERSQVEQAR
jgi:hypothetical protein